ncbi:tandem-95 repeat protein [cf. Phormidesmis sp. LEGE 11477]|uniref:Ig-like domain-containing protein n=1 Tax=cf. Phormidesmis sp. LEGE 11477 TaxID=1828680 RepID=UPI0018806C63|nr:tandem-95 repeat protein [cf. Phormidesmis sp. LEGE 11477]MBE9062325.1 tandem-95 repeat protein [cf. Phormidesmis sp. LEGE 11477]
MSNQIPTTIEASPNFLNGAAGVQSWEDDVTINAYSADGSDARISYRKAGGFGIAGGRYDNQVDYDVKQKSGERLEIDFNGNVKQASFTLGWTSPQQDPKNLGIWKAFSTSGSLVATGALDYSTATKVNKNGYQFAIATNQKFARLTMEATASASGQAMRNDSDFSLEDVTYTRLDKSITQPIKGPQISVSTTLEAAKASLGNGLGYQTWGDGVKVAGYKADGSKGRTTVGWDGIAVAGDRYDNQIDYDAKSGNSEVLKVDFGGSVRDVDIVLGRMESNEWRNLQETGKWKAYDAKNKLIASGNLDPRSSKKLGDSTYGFAIAAGEDIVSLAISATAYGNGSGTSRTNNNSDFNLQSVTYSRITDVAPGKPPKPPKPPKPQNSLPTAKADNVSTKMNQEISIDVLANDSFGADGASSDQLLIGNAANGTVSIKKQGTPGNPLDDLIQYVPNKGFTGKDKFTYTIADANGDTSMATVNVKVNKTSTEPPTPKPPTPKPPVNKKPDAVDDSLATNEDSTLVLKAKDLLSNDTLGNGPTVIASVANSSSKGGKISKSSNGTYTYTPKANFFGQDSFGYSIKDADGDTSSATVKVNVKAVNDQPKAVNDSAAVDAGKSVNIDVLSNDSFGGDGAGGAITVGSADHGNVSIRTQGTSKPSDDIIRYVADKNFGGTDSFKYTITDANGDKSTATVNVNVKKPDVAPKPPGNVGERVNLTAAKGVIQGNKSSHLWGNSVRLSATGLNGSKANVVYDTQFADKGFGVSSANDRWSQIDYYAKNGNLRGVSEKLRLKFDTLVDNVTLKVGMLGFNEGKNGNDETGKWTAYDAKGRKVGDGLLGPELSTLGKDVKVKKSYGSYPIEIDTSKPFAELVVEATPFGHGQGSPIGKSYGENNSDFNVMGISFDTLPNTQGGF